MIKIRKPNNPPTVPDGNGNCRLIQSTISNNQAYDSDQVNYDNGTRKFSFDNKIYGHKNIKDILIECQHGKCAFCEQNVRSVSYGDIEHFRPKKGFSQNNKDVLHYPGYYWIAYDWSNLFFSCQICNQRFKKNLFPLRNPERRARNHHLSMKYEKPFFVNPAMENPKFLIGFNRETAYGKDKRHRGKKTIEALGLNRTATGFSEVWELRKDYYEVAYELFEISKMTPGSQINQTKINNAANLLKKMRSKKMQFAAMIRENFPN